MLGLIPLFLNLPVWANVLLFLQICPHSTTSTMTFRQTNYTGLTQPYPQPQPGKRTIPAQKPPETLAQRPIMRFSLRVNNPLTMLESQNFECTINNASFFKFACMGKFLRSYRFVHIVLPVLLLLPLDKPAILD